MEEIENKTPSVMPEQPVAEQQVLQSAPNKPWYLIGGVVVLLLAGGLFAAAQKPKKAPVPVPQPTVRQISPSPKVTLPRSKAPGVVTSVVTAKALDAQGKAVAPVAVFAGTDKNIYLALTVNKPTIGTKIEYIRYLNGKYLDSGTNKILKPNLTNVSFVWSLKKPGATHLAGTYRVKVYTDGVLEKETTYTVR